MLFVRCRRPVVIVPFPRQVGLGPANFFLRHLVGGPLMFQLGFGFRRCRVNIESSNRVRGLQRS
jgi:hypothetical protein